MITLCEPSVPDLIIKVEYAIERIRSGNRIDSLKMHNEIKNMYNWRDVAKRTEVVYNMVSQYKTESTLVEKILK